MPTFIGVESVNVGQPQILHRLRKGPIYSSIAKQPVRVESLLLTFTNLQGDQQVSTDPKVDGRQLHGGNEMAVYVYPQEHYALWRAELDLDLPVPSFGENLTTSSIDEHWARIGDKWRWGDAILEISKPRSPCFKLKYFLDVKDVEAKMWANGRCGWYMRVLKPGVVPTNQSIEIIEHDESALTVAEAFVTKREKNGGKNTEEVAL